MSKERLSSACDLLCAKSWRFSLTEPPTSQTSKHLVPLSPKNKHSVNQIDIIDLTVDDDDENAQEQDIHMRSITQIQAEETELSAGGGVQRLSLDYHAKNHSCAELHELLEALSTKEKEELAKDVKVYKAGMKVRPFMPMLCSPYINTLIEC